LIDFNNNNLQNKIPKPDQTLSNAVKNLEDARNFIQKMEKCQTSKDLNKVIKTIEEVRNPENHSKL
jgi:hypothetical protein